MFQLSPHHHVLPQGPRHPLLLVIIAVWQHRYEDIDGTYGNMELSMEKNKTNYGKNTKNYGNIGTPSINDDMEVSMENKYGEIIYHWRFPAGKIPKWSGSRIIIVFLTQDKTQVG